MFRRSKDDVIFPVVFQSIFDVGFNRPSDFFGSLALRSADCNQIKIKCVSDKAIRFLRIPND